VVTRVGHLLYFGLAKELLRTNDEKFPQCTRHAICGVKTAWEFGGVDLCDSCKNMWRAYVQTAWERWSAALPLDR
jgi:hypothetical protein